MAFEVGQLAPLASKSPRESRLVNSDTTASSSVHHTSHIIHRQRISRCSCLPHYFRLTFGSSLAARKDHRHAGGRTGSADRPLALQFTTAAEDGRGNERRWRCVVDASIPGQSTAQWYAISPMAPGRMTQDKVAAGPACAPGHPLVHRACASLFGLVSDAHFPLHALHEMRFLLFQGSGGSGTGSPSADSGGLLASLTGP